ncbi:uncharacterized protein LOC109711956 [Ananas comosus]|uniref:Uncharacterized protein LOC109711956 n=1 Tax=Ananas comosus TaxID=4615 RepID=A0A6P5F441_ANACO|nr:uncharacterized protein LOC109711956 [Ananas comosus]
MGRRARKRSVAESSPQKPKPGGGEELGGGGGVGAARFEERQRSFNEREVDRRIAAIQAIRVAETENLLSRLRLVRSYISNEQLEKPALEFFQENLPNLSVTRNEKYKVFELNWNCKESYMPGNCRDDVNMRTSLGYAATLPATAGLQFSANSVKKSFLESANLQIPDFALDESTEDLMARAAKDAVQTPGAMSARLSFGMTPKTTRLPKNGEMLLSVHGSPLGVYKEENLAAIHESGDGGDDGIL